MNKYLSLLVLVALAATVSAAEDMQSAEQYFRTYGYWPSWYSGVYGAGLYGAGYNGLGFRSAAYPLAYNYGVHPYSYMPGHYAAAPVAEEKVEEKKVHKRSVTENEDQESAEWYYRTYGSYPSWYTGVYGTVGTPASTFKTIGAYPYYNNYAYNTGYYHNGYAY